MTKTDFLFWDFINALGFANVMRYVYVRYVMSLLKQERVNRCCYTRLSLTFTRHVGKALMYEDVLNLV